MEQDYNSFEIISSFPIFRMILTLKTENETKQIPVSIDYQNQKVYFEDNFSLNVDYNLLEAKIFEKLNFSLADQPVLDQEVLARINEMRNGKYGQDKLQI
jgi:hypothetical protein